MHKTILDDSSKCKRQLLHKTNQFLTAFKPTQSSFKPSCLCGVFVDCATPFCYVVIYGVEMLSIRLATSNAAFSSD